MTVLDYATIANGLHFRRGRKIAAHDNVIYFGDLNYRIQLPNEQVRQMASIDDYAGLIEGDQVSIVASYLIHINTLLIYQHIVLCSLRISKAHEMHEAANHLRWIQ